MQKCATFTMNMHPRTGAPTFRLAQAASHETESAARPLASK